MKTKTKRKKEKTGEKNENDQKNDFKKIFSVMSGLPVTVRLLDPPLHEFLPKKEKDIEEVARSLNLGAKEIKDRISELHEENPMLGHRGCRLGISFPEIYEMQCEAIFEALVDLQKEKKKILKANGFHMLNYRNRIVFTGGNGRFGKVFKEKAKNKRS